MKHWLRFISLILILILITACGGGNKTAETEDTSEPDPAVEQEEREGETAVVIEEDKAGGTFVFAMEGEPNSLDCQLTGFAAEVCALAGASLVIRDPETAEVTPWLAERWEASDDGLTYTFTLKEGIIFHDGTPFTAADYAFTLNRAIDPDNTSLVLAETIAAVEQAEATDDRTLVIHLAYPDALFLENLTNEGFTMAYSQAWVEANDIETINREIMSVGPYRFKEWVTGEKIVMERNLDYNWHTPYSNHDGPFYIETFEFRYLPEPETILLGMETGEIDGAVISGKDVARVESMGSFTIFETPTTYGFMSLILNQNVPPLDDVRVRQALNYAIDPNPIIAIVESGAGVPAYGPLGPTANGYNEKVAENGFDYDPEQAKILLQEVGYVLNDDGIFEKDGELLAFTINTMQEKETQMTEILLDQFKDVGIEITINPLDRDQAVGAIFTGDHQITTLEFQVDNASLLPRLYGQQGIGALTFAPNLETETLFEQVNNVNALLDEDAWLENIRALQETVMLDLTISVPIYHPVIYTAVSNEFKDILINTDGDLYYDDGYYIGE